MVLKNLFSFCNKVIPNLVPIKLNVSVLLYFLALSFSTTSIVLKFLKLCTSSIINSEFSLKTKSEFKSC